MGFPILVRWHLYIESGPRILLSSGYLHADDWLCWTNTPFFGDKTILRPSYLHNGISYTGKMTSLYWIRAQDPFVVRLSACRWLTLLDKYALLFQKKGFQLGIGQWWKNIFMFFDINWGKVGLTHWGWVTHYVTHISIKKVDHHWFRLLVACSVPCYHLNQWWRFVDCTLRNIFQWNFIQNFQVFI